MLKLLNIILETSIIGGVGGFLSVLSGFGVGSIYDSIFNTNHTDTIGSICSIIMIFIVLLCCAIRIYNKINNTSNQTIKARVTISPKKQKKSRSQHLLNLADILRFFLPDKVREKIYEPYEQELKKDFILAASKPHTKIGRFFIWLGFYLRLTIAFFQSLTCWILGTFPSLFKALLGIGGTPKSD